MRWILKMFFFINILFGVEGAWNKIGWRGEGEGVGWESRGWEGRGC